MRFVLYNSLTNTYLQHPLLGLWSSANRAEAEEMLRVATEFTAASGYGFLDNKLCVKEVPPDFDPQVEQLRKWIDEQEK